MRRPSTGKPRGAVEGGGKQLLPHHLSPRMFVQIWAGWGEGGETDFDHQKAEASALLQVEPGICSTTTSTLYHHRAMDVLGGGVGSSTLKVSTGYWRNKGKFNSTQCESSQTFTLCMRI